MRNTTWDARRAAAAVAFAGLVAGLALGCAEAESAAHDGRWSGEEECPAGTYSGCVDAVCPEENGGCKMCGGCSCWPSPDLLAIDCCGTVLRYSCANAEFLAPGQRGAMSGSFCLYYVDVLNSYWYEGDLVPCLDAPGPWPGGDSFVPLGFEVRSPYAEESGCVPVLSGDGATEPWGCSSDGRHLDCEPPEGTTVRVHVAREVLEPSGVWIYRVQGVCKTD
jgi:hypothetical protein